MIISSYIQDKIKKACIERGIPHYKVLPYVKGFYLPVKEGRAWPREILTTAYEKIAEIKKEEGINEATKIAQRNKIIQDQKNNNHE